MIHNENSTFMILNTATWIILIHWMKIMSCWLTLAAETNTAGPWPPTFGRLSYDYKETYLFTAVLRYDGSSNFDRGHRWGSFPSVSAGWVISNESFMQNTSNWLNFAKLRVSWGQNGNQDIGRDFVYLSTLDVTGVNYFFGPIIRS